MISAPVQSSPYTFQRRLRDLPPSILRYLFTLFNIPGFVKPIEYADRKTGDYISVRVSPRFTVVSINNRDYYFRRFTGGFDGTGYVVRRPTIEESLCCILAGSHVSTHPLSLWGRLKLALQSIGRGCSARYKDCHH